MDNNTVYIMECGGGVGCTEKLHMSNPDFMIVLNNKHYRFSTTNGNLSILCINGVNEKIGVKDGYKNLVITQHDNDWNPYEETRLGYIQAVEDAKRGGCVDCPFRVDSPIYQMCGASGESFIDSVPARGSRCPHC